ncbi:MAG: hypothetical protein HY204_07510 [Nitrospirae bacterium]|nr:hypothetical protein [Nitrospirota bacterium]
MLFRIHPLNSKLFSAPWIALATAFLFIVHPIQTQAVTYIVQRFASLAALFYLLAVVCYLKWRQSELTTQNSKFKTPKSLATMAVRFETSV